MDQFCIFQALEQFKPVHHMFSWRYKKKVFCFLQGPNIILVIILNLWRHKQFLNAAVLFKINKNLSLGYNPSFCSVNGLYATMPMRGGSQIND
jgi:hypothetical protein